MPEANCRRKSPIQSWGSTGKHRWGFSKPLHFKEGPNEVGLRKLKRGHCSVDAYNQKRGQ